MNLADAKINPTRPFCLFMAAGRLFLYALVLKSTYTRGYE